MSFLSNTYLKLHCCYSVPYKEKSSEHTDIWAVAIQTPEQNDMMLNPK